MGRDLSGQADDRDRIHQGIGQTGDRVGGARAGGDQNHARLAGRPGIAFRRVHRAAFLAHQNVPDRVLAEQRVVERQHSAARIPENHVNALVDQGFQDDLRSFQLLTRHVAFLSIFRPVAAALASTGGNARKTRSGALRALPVPALA